MIATGPGRRSPGPVRAPICGRVRAPEPAPGPAPGHALALAVLLVALAPPPAEAFRFHDPATSAPLRPDEPGVRTRWDLREFPGAVIPFAVRENCRDTSPVAPAVGAAAGAWNEAGAGALVLAPAGIARAALFGDSTNSIFWDDANATGVLPVGEAVLGITLWSHTSTASGRLSEVDIVLNDRECLWTTTDGNAFAEAIVYTGVPPFYDFDDDDDGRIDHNVLQVVIHGDDVRTITFEEGDFGNLDFGSRKEVRDAIDAKAGFLRDGHRVRAVAYLGGGVSIEDEPALPIGPETGEISIHVVGGSANQVLLFPTEKVVGSLRFDVETVVLHELGHLLGLAHSDPDREPVMFSVTPDSGTKTIPTPDDAAGLRVLYAQDVGAAPDPPYPTAVRSAVPGRELNGLGLVRPGPGAVHLQGPWPGFRYEWLGPPGGAPHERADDGVDGNPNDGVDGNPNDGVTLLPPCDPTGACSVLVSISIAADDSGRAHPCGGDRSFHLNAWFDWDGDGAWEEPGEHAIAFATCAAGAHAFRVEPPGGPVADSVWCRFRLDWGEDAGAVRNANGDLDGPRGAAQFGEVEDHLLRVRSTPVRLLSFEATDEGDGAHLRWRTGEGTDAAGYHVLREHEGGPRVRLTGVPVRATARDRTEAEHVWVDPSPPPEGTVDYFLSEVRANGAPGEVLGPARLVRPTLERALRAPHPNPATRGFGAVTLPFMADGSRGAHLAIYDAAGRRVAVILEGPVSRGVHSPRWDGLDASGRPAAAGLYFARLRLDGWSASRKLVVLP